jgi:hypothetical protein
MAQRNEFGDVTITLTEEDYTYLLIMLGYACGAASERKDDKADLFLDITTKVIQS